MTKFDTLKAEREKRIKGYIKQNLTAQQIGDREGLELDYAGKMRRKLGGKDTKAPANDGKSFGLTDATFRFRVKLGDMLNHETTVKRLHHMQVAHSTGITMREQKQAKDNSDKNLFNWKLSQIERMARMIGVDVNKVFIHALTHDLKILAAKEKITVGALVDKWITEKEASNGPTTRRR